MAICDWCGEEMMEADSCITEEGLNIQTPDGVQNFSPVKFGEESRFSSTLELGSFTPLEPNDQCPDCNVKIGGYHHPGCDVEECPYCRRQMLSHDCEFV